MQFVAVTELKRLYLVQGTLKCISAKEGRHTNEASQSTVRTARCNPSEGNQDKAAIT